MQRPTLRRLANASAAAEIDNPVDAGGEHQNGRQDPTRIFAVGETPHLAEGGVGPADGRCADCDLGRRRGDRGGALVAARVGGQHICPEKGA